MRRGRIAQAEAFIVGAYEHPARKLPGTSLAEIHAQVGLGALADAGLTLADVDGYLGSGDAPGGLPAVVDYLGLELSYLDSTDIGGSSYVDLVNKATAAISRGECSVALITMAGRPLTGKRRGPAPDSPFLGYESAYGHSIAGSYALLAQRHMFEHGTTPEQLAEVKVAASAHAQHNPHARLPRVVTVEDVLGSPMIASPLHRLDCCVITDGGGAVVVVSPDVWRGLGRRGAGILAAASTIDHTRAGRVDLTKTGARRTGPRALAQAGIVAEDIDYASIYDSFTITVIQTLEDLEFCAPGQGGRFVEEGALRAPHGRLPINTDGGSLCNNHPGNRGGMPRLIEAVRQLRHEAHPAVQVPDCELALVHGTGGHLGTRTGAATLVLGRP